jgi:hypothetical protein
MSTTQDTATAAKLLSLADTLRTKLPRELRDIVYSYVWNKETVDGLQISLYLDTDHSEYFRVGALTSVPAAANKELVGVQIAAEAVEWLFGNSCDIMIGGPHQLRKFFEMDLFGAEVRARDVAIRKLTMIIHMGTVTASDVSEIKATYAPFTTGLFQKSFVLKILILPKDDDRSASLRPRELLEIASELRLAISFS